MEIRQFYDESLAHASYAVESDGQMAIIDPARDPKPYFEFAETQDSRITVIIETHPHADFVSSHLEIRSKTGATIYASKYIGADYPHETFDTGNTLPLGKVTLKAFNTPGHSPDSISVVVTDESGKDHAVFTGDTLFIGDVGRPDLREKAGNIMAKREQLARDMYHSTRNILMKLEKDVKVFPAHGAGSLCGKALSKELTSTIGRQLQENYALQDMSEDEFVRILLEDQPFMPKYFGFNVEVNRAGAENFEENVRKVPRLPEGTMPEGGTTVVDTRSRTEFDKGHLPGAINIIEDGRFETWLGSIIAPGEPFYLIASDNQALEGVIRRAAKIGYEKNILGALLNPAEAGETSPELDFEDFRKNPDHFTIVDVRNESETRNERIFENSINIPLYELRERVSEIPRKKSVVVFCAGGYRSAAASSIIAGRLKDVKTYDLGEKIKEFKATVASALE